VILGIGVYREEQNYFWNVFGQQSSYFAPRPNFKIIKFKKNSLMYEKIMSLV
jgi:hypothetical protein